MVIAGHLENVNEQKQTKKSTKKKKEKSPLIRVGEGHKEPRNSGSLWKLEKIRRLRKKLNNIIKTTWRDSHTGKCNQGPLMLKYMFVFLFCCHCMVKNCPVFLPGLLQTISSERYEEWEWLFPSLSPHCCFKDGRKPTVRASRSWNWP